MRYVNAICIVLVIVIIGSCMRNHPMCPFSFVRQSEGISSDSFGGGVIEGKTANQLARGVSVSIRARRDDQGYFGRVAQRQTKHGSAFDQTFTQALIMGNN